MPTSVQPRRKEGVKPLCVAAQDFKKRVDLESMSAAYSRIRTSTGITEGASSPCSHAGIHAHCTPWFHAQERCLSSAARSLGLLSNTGE